MFKKSRGGSGFKSSKVSSGATDKKGLLEELGYTFDSVTRKSGWSWSAANTSSAENQPSEAEAIADAWRDAGAQAQKALDIPVDT
jgi:hypothetical protein